jgi:hypothetical protein
VRTWKNNPYFTKEVSQRNTKKNISNACHTMQTWRSAFSFSSEVGLLRHGIMYLMYIIPEDEGEASSRIDLDIDHAFKEKPEEVQMQKLRS